MIKILIVDDHLLLREGIKCVLGTYNDLQVTAEAYDGEHALRTLKTNKFDIVISDINMPKMNGIELIRRVNHLQERARCIILSTYADEGFVTEAIKAGAKGYILKSASAETIVEAINKVSSGGHYFHTAMPKNLQKIAATTMNGISRLSAIREKSLAGKAAKQPERRRPGRKRQEELTVREIELLNMLGQGMRTKEIADKLYLSDKTIKNHLTSIFRKLKVDSRTQAVCAAVRQKIVIMQ